MIQSILLGITQFKETNPSISDKIIIEKLDDFFKKDEYLKIVCIAKPRLSRLSNIIGKHANNNPKRINNAVTASILHYLLQNLKELLESEI